MQLLPSRGARRAWRPLARPAAVAVFAVAAAGWTAAYDPEQHPHRFPSCLFLAVTGLECPSCGGTRMMHRLLHRRWRAALHANPVLLILGLPMLGWLWLRWVAAAMRGERPEPVPRPVALVVLAVALAWTVARNTWLRRR